MRERTGLGSKVKPKNRWNGAKTELPTLVGVYNADLNEIFWLRGIFSKENPLNSSRHREWCFRLNQRIQINGTYCYNLDSINKLREKMRYGSFSNPLYWTISGKTHEETSLHLELTYFFHSIAPTATKSLWNCHPTSSHVGFFLISVFHQTRFDRSTHPTTSAVENSIFFWFSCWWKKNFKWYGPAGGRKKQKKRLKVTLNFGGRKMDPRDCRFSSVSCRRRLFCGDAQIIGDLQ